MKPRLLYVVTEDWYFESHRLALAEAARDDGFEVAVATRVQTGRQRIVAAGLRVHDVDIPRRMRQPRGDVRAIVALRRLYRAERPDIVHHIALKPILLGSIAAMTSGAPATVNAYAGLGHLFTSHDLHVRLLRRMAVPVLRAAVARSNVYTIVQNRDDLQRLIELRVADPRRTELIPGAGVDMGRFVPRPAPSGEALVILPARLNRNKGVSEFAAAAHQLRAQGCTARFALVGAIDSGNPTAVDAADIARWTAAGDIEYWGARDSMAEVYAQASIVCVPSHGGEGMPKVLLEAGACERAVIATDTSGCRDIVIHEDTGLLVAARDVDGLAGAIMRLLRQPDLRRRLAGSLHQRVRTGFAAASITTATLAMYRRILAERAQS